jgi:hypothetical protein
MPLMRGGNRGSIRGGKTVNKVWRTGIGLPVIAIGYTIRRSIVSRLMKTSELLKNM